MINEPKFAQTQWLTGDQAEHQILGIIQSLAIWAATIALIRINSACCKEKWADCDPEEQKKSKVRVMPCAASASPQCCRGSATAGSARLLMASELSPLKAEPSRRQLAGLRLSCGLVAAQTVFVSLRLWPTLLTFEASPSPLNTFDTLCNTSNTIFKVLRMSPVPLLHIPCPLGPFFWVFLALLLALDFDNGFLTGLLIPNLLLCVVVLSTSPPVLERHNVLDVVRAAAFHPHTHLTQIAATAEPTSLISSLALSMMCFYMAAQFGRLAGEDNAAHGEHTAS
ncbi:hypothetical protein DFH08DRAFT_811775 [Mycena albidolilacea]|uniref:Uncharacterized protein n=1 Tax=Mycena albidolilacea TaxID=1033008 RepID=A0AAD7EPD6_9AGAR|nr:hypothetical protein DFH08DRAFT_811775 [Mycena albidolilacea]